MSNRKLAALAMLLCLIVAQTPARVAANPFDTIYEDIWQRWLQEDPTLATSVGDHRYDDRWPDLSIAAIERAHAQDEAALARLAGMPSATLTPAEQLDLDIVKFELERRLSLARFKPALYAVSHLGGLQNSSSLQTANELSEVAPFATVGDYEHWIARLRAFGVFADQTMALLRQGMREKRLPPRVVMERVRPQLAAQQVADPADSPFFAPFKTIPRAIGDAERARLTDDGRKAIAEVVLPAFRRFGKYFEATYLPACRNGVGIDATPDGAAYYRELIAYHTTTHLAPGEIHDIGLREVARIHGEMEAIMAQVGFKGSLQDFFHYLRTDPRFFYTDPTELLHGYMVIAKSIDPQLVTLFGKLPRTPYGVRPVPDTSAPNTTTAYYQPMAPDGSRPGYFYVNLYKPEARPKWEMAVLATHESVPGHHLQTALQYENAERIPMIRRMSDFTVYVEGWGLYAESLGESLGLYADPYQKFGELTYDMWRAVRLVVDTGIHSQGWTRQRAIDYFMANAPKSELDITNEVDRYIAWPGQALAYKVGQLKLFELRDEARRTLGERFDIRAFHDTVLAAGAVPLSMLERLVREWIAKQVALPPPRVSAPPTDGARPGA